VVLAMPVVVAEVSSSSILARFGSHFVVAVLDFEHDGFQAMLRL